METKMLNQEIVMYFFENYEAEIAKRAYDGKFIVWQPVLDLHEDNSFSIYWNCYDVCETIDDANKSLNKIKIKKKNNDRNATENNNRNI